MLVLLALAASNVVRRAEVDAASGDLAIETSQGPPGRTERSFHSWGVPQHADAKCFSEEYCRPGYTCPESHSICEAIEDPSWEKCKAAGCAFAPAIEIEHTSQSPRYVKSCHCNTECGGMVFEGHDISRMYERKDYHDNPWSGNYNRHWSRCDGYEGNGPNHTCHHTVCASCHWSDTPCPDDSHITQITRKERTLFSDQYLCCSPNKCAAEYVITTRWEGHLVDGTPAGPKSAVRHGIAFGEEGEHPSKHTPPNRDCTTKEEWTKRGFSTEPKKRKDYGGGCDFSYGIFSVLYGECGIWPR